MDRLPKEIVLLIIADFNFVEKLQCALVCRKWLDWIRESNLYKYVNIADSNKRYRTALDYFSHYDYGRLVSELILDNCDSTLVALLQLPELFPNLKTFEWRQAYDEERADYSIYEQEIQDRYYEKQLQKWKHLEEIKEENNYFPVTTAILKSPSSAANLRQISIKCPVNELSTTPDDIKVQQNMSTILKYIQNAPELETLELENFLVTWDNMDRLHKKVKHLKTINFSNMFLRSAEEYSEEEEEESSDESTTSVDHDEPAESVEEFNIDYASDVFELERGNIYWWTRYMAKKYKNIKSFSLTYSDWIFMPISATSFEETMQFCLPCWPCLKEYNVKIGGLTKTLLDVMDSNQITLENVTIYIEEPGGIEQFKNLATSKQVESIQSLKIVERSKFGEEGEEYGVDMFALLRQIPKLQHIQFELAIPGTLVYQLHDPTLITHTLNNATHIESMIAPSIQTPPTAFIPVNHDTKLRHLKIDYLQFCCDNNAEYFNQTLSSILHHCPLLETFSAAVNFYESQERNTVLEFDFTKNKYIKKIQINCLYKTTYRVIRNGEIKHYNCTQDNRFIEASEQEITSPFVVVKVNNGAAFTANILN